MNRPMSRAVRLDPAIGHPGLVEVPRPRPAALEVLVRVMAAAVGPVDRDVASRLRAAGRPGHPVVTLGHSFVGAVATVGQGVEGWAPGTRVAVAPVASGRHGLELLGVTHDGGWAEYVAVRVDQLVRVPAGVTDAGASLVPGTAGVAWHALLRDARLAPGEAVEVWGDSEAAAHAVVLARLIGGAPVVSVATTDVQREFAEAWRADAVLDPSSATFASDRAALTGREGPAVVLDCGGAEDGWASELLLHTVGPGTRVVLVGGLGRPATSAIATRAAQVIRGGATTQAGLRVLLKLAAHGRLPLDDFIAGVEPLIMAPAAVGRTAGARSTVLVPRSQV